MGNKENGNSPPRHPDPERWRGGGISYRAAQFLKNRLIQVVPLWVRDDVGSYKIRIFLHK